MFLNTLIQKLNGRVSLVDCTKNRFYLVPSVCKRYCSLVTTSTTDTICPTICKDAPCYKPTDTKIQTNEPVYSYLYGSYERCELQYSLCRLSCPITDIPIVIGDEEIKMDQVCYRFSPYDHQTKVARYYIADSEIIKRAMRNCTATQRSWDKTKFEDRIKIFERAADLAAGPYRQKLNAATILGQGKTVIQAEIDAACELVDFFRNNCTFLSNLLKWQPCNPCPNLFRNYFRFRGCEGFWAAISPFNFTAIAGNLATAPVLMGNAVVWKPSNDSILSNWIIFQILREAGLPPGVINFVPSNEQEFGDLIIGSQDLAGINFTGSTNTFNSIYKAVSNNLENYRNYPRFVGELGGKNFHFVHVTADCCSVVNQTIRSAFEYSGQKCSACSIIYVPTSMYQTLATMLMEAMDKIFICHPTNFSSFMSSVINEKAFERIKGYIEFARSCKDTEIIKGGCCDSEIGYYIEPTLITCTDCHNKLMKEEIFGPVLVMYVYDECEIDKVMEMIANDSPYALTASIFAYDDEFITKAMNLFKMCAGNFYINDKSTGAVVGQQPFGGSRNSGTNDKAGGPHYLLRFTNPLTIKQSFTCLEDYNYPYMCPC